LNGEEREWLKSLKYKIKNKKRTQENQVNLRGPPTVGAGHGVKAIVIFVKLGGQETNKEKGK